MHARSLAAVIAVGVVGALVAASAVPQSPASAPTDAAASTGIAPQPPSNAPPDDMATALALLTRPIPDSTPDAARLRQGRSLAIAGDCVSCHLREGGEPFAGGRPMHTPFGVVYTANITPDAQTGIGSWTADDFYRALHDGIDDEGRNLYPAFPYPWFRRVTREDSDAIYAFLKSVPAVVYTPPSNELPFPLRIRFLVKGWNLLFLRGDTYAPDPAQSAEWNRGAYLVEGLGHCGACHTPKNFLGADKSGRRYHGGTLERWVAPDLTGHTRTGLGAWNATEVDAFLRAGRNERAAAGGTMSEVVTYSTSLLPEEDRRAIALYLKSLAPRDDAGVEAADAASLRRGAAIYGDVCTACHLEQGVGQPGVFPPLARDTMLQQPDPTGVIHAILAGSRIAATPTRTSTLTMPSMAWKLSDQEVADVATYVRNAWGNQAVSVKAADVQRLRRELGLPRPGS
jgi:mono/diheme cytochrome c family protein